MGRFSAFEQLQPHRRQLCALSARPSRVRLTTRTGVPDRLALPRRRRYRHLLPRDGGGGGGGRWRAASPSISRPSAAVGEAVFADGLTTSGGGGGGGGQRGLEYRPARPGLAVKRCSMHVIRHWCLQTNVSYYLMFQRGVVGGRKLKPGSGQWNLRYFASEDEAKCIYFVSNCFLLIIKN